MDKHAGPWKNKLTCQTVPIPRATELESMVLPYLRPIVQAHTSDRFKFTSHIKVV